MNSIVVSPKRARWLLAACFADLSCDVGYLCRESGLFEKGLLTASEEDKFVSA